MPGAFLCQPPGISEFIITAETLYCARKYGVRLAVTTAGSTGVIQLMLDPKYIFELEDESPVQTEGIDTTASRIVGYEYSEGDHFQGEYVPTFTVSRNGGITVRQKDVKAIINVTNTPGNRVKLLYCKSCGTEFTPQESEVSLTGENDSIRYECPNCQAHNHPVKQ